MLLCKDRQAFGPSSLRLKNKTWLSSPPLVWHRGRPPLRCETNLLIWSPLPGGLPVVSSSGRGHSPAPHPIWFLPASLGQSRLVWSIVLGLCHPRSVSVSMSFQSASHRLSLSLSLLLSHCWRKGMCNVPENDSGRESKGHGEMERDRGGGGGVGETRRASGREILIQLLSSFSDSLKFRFHLAVNF